MTYKGFTILLERTQCEFWTLNDAGDADEYLRDCDDSTHDGVHKYVVIDSNNRERASVDTIEEARQVIDGMDCGPRGPHG